MEETIMEINKTKIGFIEHIALNSGRVGYWLIILWTSILVGIGGMIIGVVLAGIMAATRDVDIESDDYGTWMTFGTSIVCALLGGYFCRRRLSRIRRNVYENKMYD